MDREDREGKWCWSLIEDNKNSMQIKTFYQSYFEIILTLNLSHWDNQIVKCNIVWLATLSVNIYVSGKSEKKMIQTAALI